MTQPQTELQAFLVIAFSLTFLAGMAGSIAAWMWALRNWVKIARWSGWDKDQPRVLIGLIDLVGCFFCLLLTQIMVLAVVHLVMGAESMRSQPLEIPVLQGNLMAIPKRADDGTQVMSADRILESIAKESDLESEMEGVPSRDSEMPTWLTPFLTLSFLLGGLLAAAFVMFRTGARPAQIGVNLERFVIDCKIGGLVFLLVTPVILVLSQIAISVTEVKYEHPVMDAMSENPWAFPMLFLGAVVCAPLWEEFVFRGLLIGWFDSLRASRGDLRSIVFGGRAEGHSSVGSTTEPNASLFSRAEFPNSHPNNSQSTNLTPLTVASSAVESKDELRADAPLPPWWPAIVSGALFGLLHYGYGVSWIPLIVLGVVLGRIYQLRRSIVPVVVTHALFNSLSMLGLAVQILGGKG